MSRAVLIAIPLLPLAAAVIAGLAGRLIGRTGAHPLPCLAVAGSCVLSLLVLKQVWLDGVPVYDAPLYTWLVSEGLHMEVGFLVARLTVPMFAVVAVVSLVGPVYTIRSTHTTPTPPRAPPSTSLPPIPPPTRP